LSRIGSSCFNAHSTIQSLQCKPSVEFCYLPITSQTSGAAY
jgi:hypothetical protein